MSVEFKETMLIVGGSFDDNGGKPSSLVSKLGEAVMQDDVGFDVKLYNGGHYDLLEVLLEESKHFDYVIWWANVLNDKPKIRNVKDVNPRAMLVTSKRNDNNKYSFAELINRALGSKANLCVQFSKVEDRFTMMLFDPLGNSWYSGDSIPKLYHAMAERLKYLKSITRQGCVHTDDNIEIPDEREFFDIVRNYADTFHELIKPDSAVTRFLGNSSFRCQRGFPSFRKDDMIFVSRRNVDKRFIDKSAFVPVKLEDDTTLYYYGDSKPSVDTPIQARLYKLLPNINYMIHAHVYISGAPFTKSMIPCGGLEEVEEVMTVIGDDTEEDFYAINLIGHGCIVMAKDVEQLKYLHYISRPLPERLC
jgi:ribulose-5-phosphate 4-epimerase/fuculose-1-phosphate aldolase